MSSEEQTEKRDTMDTAMAAEHASDDKVHPQSPRPDDEDDAPVDNDMESLREAIRVQAREDESPDAPTFTLRKILGGDFLTAATIRRHAILIVVVVIFSIIYVTNRYRCQHDMIEIDKLEKALTDAKYKSLSASSELTELCRESNVLKMLRQSKDSMLSVADQPPYIIKVKKEP